MSKTINRLKAQLTEQWKTQSPDQQIMSLVCITLLSVIILSLAVISPLQKHKGDLRHQVMALSKTQQQVQELAEQLGNKQQQDEPGKGQNVTSTDGSLIRLVNNSLDKNHIRMSGFQPNNNGGATLRFDEVNYTDFMQWLYELEIEHQLVIDELSIHQTAKPGMISVSLKTR